MKNKFKKIICIALAAMMVFSMSIASFAATGYEPSSSDKATIYVKNVESGTVKAYQLISATYDSKGNGLTGYEIADGVEIEDIEEPTAEEIATIAQNINNGSLTLTSVTLTEDDDDFSASLSAGMWLILVYDSGTTIYNPMIVSIWYTDANLASSITAGSVDASTDKFVEGENEIYAKSTTTYIEKTITNSNGNDYGSDYNVGDEVSFEITSVFPDYSDAYDDDTVTFIIKDTLSAGLDPVTKDNVTVKVGGSEVTASTSTYTISAGQTITISFYSDYIIAHGTEEIVVTYTTTLNEDAILAESTSQNTNYVQLTYTNEYTVNSETKTTTVDTTNYVYTFAITDEIVKIASGGSVSSSGTDVDTTDALSGAEFTIYTDSSCSTIYTNDLTEGVYTTTSTGYVTFQGLEAGTYYITETDSPSGYYINDTVYKVVITPTYNSDGTLAQYTVSVTDLSDNTTLTNTYKYTYNTSGTVNITVSQSPTAVVDSVLQELPSTGGIGLYIIIALSLAIMITCVLIVCKKKKTAD